MNRPKGQHFVAQSYLRGFANGAGNDARVYVYERGRDDPYRQHPKKVARQTNYYSFRQPDGTLNDSAEDLLGWFESDSLPVLRSLANGSFQNTWAERERLGLFIALQELRVPWTPKNLENMYGVLFDHSAKFRAWIPGLLEQDLRELEARGEAVNGVTADNLREFLQRGEHTLKVDPVVSLKSMIQLAPMIGAIYQEMEWRVFRSTEIAFVTSDNPVAKLNPAARGSMGSLGLFHRTIEVRFPLSSTSYLVMTHDHQREDAWQQFMEAGKKIEASNLRKTVPRVVVLGANKRVADSLNALTIAYAVRFVYSRERDARFPAMLRNQTLAPRLHVG
jgi:hypothetical protein